MKHTVTVFRFIDKCVNDLDNPTQLMDNIKLVAKIHAFQGIGVKDFVIIKGKNKMKLPKYQVLAKRFNLI